VRGKLKRTTLRFRKHDPVHNVLAAVQRWVNYRGGDIVVIGGVSVITFPGEPEGAFWVAVKCLGRKPKKEAKNGVRADAGSGSEITR